MASEKSGNEMDRIRERAYHIWLSQGRPHGQEMAHWLAAERELGAGPVHFVAPGDGAAAAGQSPVAALLAEAAAAVAPDVKPRRKAAAKPKASAEAKIKPAPAAEAKIKPAPAAEAKIKPAPAAGRSKPRTGKTAV